jgi:hypothetical protein
MPRYYFHARDDRHSTSDNEGVELRMSTRPSMRLPRRLVKWRKTCGLEQCTTN